MGKKDDIRQQVEDLISDCGEDRERLVKFIDDLIAAYSGESIGGIAEHVAKLVDSLTKQMQIRVAVIKAGSKGTEMDSEDQAELDELSKKIGMPFESADDVDEDSN